MSSPKASDVGTEKAIAERIEQLGYDPDPSARFRRSVQTLRCQQCQSIVLTGLDAEMCAFNVSLDPQPLSALGEMLAHLDADPWPRWSGRTYDVISEGRRRVIERREAGHIISAPAGEAGAVRYDVHRVHRCDARALAAAETTTSAFVVMHAKSSDAPPF